MCLFTDLFCSVLKQTGAPRKESHSHSGHRQSLYVCCLMPLQELESTQHLQPILPFWNTTGAWHRGGQRTPPLSDCTKTMRDPQLCRFEWCSIATQLLHMKPSTALLCGQPPWGTGAVAQMNPLTFTAKSVGNALGRLVHLVRRKGGFYEGSEKQKNCVGAPLESLNHTHVGKQAGANHTAWSKSGRTGPQRQWQSWTNGSAQQPSPIGH